MGANLPSPLSQQQSESMQSDIATEARRIAHRLLALGFAEDIVKRELAFALAHLAAEYGLDPTGAR